VIAIVHLGKILRSKAKINLLSVLVACAKRSVIEDGLAKGVGCRFPKSIDK
jgi:hypothetical protein